MPRTETFVLHLGGDPYRAATTARIAATMPFARVIISSETNPVGVGQVLDRAGVSRNRVTFEWVAYDTLTNFTTTRKRILEAGARELIIVTDRAHMLRAYCIARVLYKGTPVVITPFICDECEPAAGETDIKTGIDMLRALIWRWTRIPLINPFRRRRVLNGFKTLRAPVW